MERKDDRLIETCLVCLVAWDVDYEPPECHEADHPHALNTLSDWSKVGHGVADTDGSLSQVPPAPHTGRL